MMRKIFTAICRCPRMMWLGNEKAGRKQATWLC